MRNFQFLAVFLTGFSSFAGELKIEEFEGRYGTLYFHGRVCTWYECKYPELYGKHRVDVKADGENLIFDFVSPERRLSEIVVSKRRFQYYSQQDFGPPHEGFEAAGQGAPKKISESPGENGTVVTIYDVPVFEIRLPKFKQKPTDSEFDYGVELIQGTVTRRSVRARDGTPVSDEIQSMDVRELQNQYLKDYPGDAPNF